MRYLILVGYFLTVYSKAYTQLVNIESQRMQTDSIRFAGNGNLLGTYQKNNASEFYQISTSLAYQYKSKSLKNSWLILGSYDWAKFKNASINNKGFSHLRFNHKMNPWLKLECYTQYQINQILGLKYRFLNGIGLRFKLYKSTKTKAYFGASSFYEVEETLAPENLLYKNFRASFYGVFTLKFPKDNGELNTVTYYQPIVNHFSDFRISSQVNFIFKITKTWAFTSALNFLYDSNPPASIQRDAIYFQNGIRFSL
jgi:hypothetical protein